MRAIEQETRARNAVNFLQRASVAQAAYISHQADRKQEIHRIIAGLETAHWRGSQVPGQM